MNDVIKDKATQAPVISETKPNVSQNGMMDLLAGKIGEWTKIVGERGVAVRHDYLKACEELKRKDLILYCIEEITYEEDSPQLEALENALSCMTVPGMNLVYLILGNRGRVRFYFGFARDMFAVNVERDPVRQVGEAFLRPALEGNFRGSMVRELGPEEMVSLRKEMAEFFKNQENCRVLAGVPGGVRDKEKQDFRGIDRLVDVMQGDKFGFMILAKPIGNDRLVALRKDVFSAYEMLATMSASSVQMGKNAGESKSESVNNGKTVSTGTSESNTVGTNESRTKGRNDGTSHGGSYDSSSSGTSSSTTHGGSKSKTTGTSKNVSENTGIGKTWGTQNGSSLAINMDLTNKVAADWVKYFDDVLIPRLDYARGKGAFVVNMTLFGENPQVAHKLSRAARSIFAGETANMVPLLSRIPDANECGQLANFAIPFEKITDETVLRLPYAQAGLLEYGGMAQLEDRLEPVPVLYSGNWMSVRELALMAGLPQKEVIGLRLKEEVEFGLNVPDAKDKDGRPITLKDEDQILLGSLVKSGNLCDGCMVKLAKDQLDRHVFVAGVTGSGKTTTCQTLLLSSGWPFLVIEPAKTEYRGLRMASDKEAIRKQCEDMLVFTLGDDTEAPFRLNPFELIPGESVTSRVDMLMASITAAFDMEAAIPQLIERAIYACYEEYGWSLDTNENADYEDPFADGVFAFPTLSDVLKKTEAVVDEQGFDDRLKKDYIGSIKARLQGLTLGAKGFMLDTPRSVDFLKLLDRKVVLELEEIPNAAQKSLIIGFVLTNLLQAVKYKFKQSGKVNHITLIEEAHRLLSKPEPGGSPSQKQAAETFADMLAEIRKYGESLVIADQIPGKLTPEVMKNTNTKIIHRLFARDDKEAVGHTMGLEEEQANFLSSLQIGRAVVFNGNWPKAIQVQITQTYRTDTMPDQKETESIRKAALEFYASDWKRGVFACSNLLKSRPDVAALEQSARRLRELVQVFRHVGNIYAKETSSLVVQELCNKFGIDTVAVVLSDENAAAELVAVRNKDVKLETLKFPAISKLVKKFDCATVWAVLARREYGRNQAAVLAPKWETFLNEMSEYDLKSGDVNWTAKVRALRKELM